MYCPKCGKDNGKYRSSCIYCYEPLPTISNTNNSQIIKTNSSISNPKKPTQTSLKLWLVFSVILVFLAIILLDFRNKSDNQMKKEVLKTPFYPQFQNNRQQNNQQVPEPPQFTVNNNSGYTEKDIQEQYSNNLQQNNQSTNSGFDKPIKYCNPQIEQLYSQWVDNMNQIMALTSENITCCDNILYIKATTENKRDILNQMSIRYNNFTQIVNYLKSLRQIDDELIVAYKNEPNKEYLREFDQSISEKWKEYDDLKEKEVIADRIIE
jgi:hypothetical protein